MCGILAVWSKQAVVDAPACRRALSTMAWRGPDFMSSRVWQDRLFLGQTVLSITGRPSARDVYRRSHSGRWEVLYNGEIYNWKDLHAQRLVDRAGLSQKFGTDTEVLANLHEVLLPEDVPGHLDGMFAYVLFDEEARHLHLVRDPQGEKSLYVYDDDDRLIVASEIGAIRLLVPHLRPDPQSLRDYFRTRHLMLFGRTVYGGVRELHSGTHEEVDLETGHCATRRFMPLQRWIDPDRLAKNQERSTDSLTDELDALIDRCVKEMLPQNVPYAAVVSGGVDSSVLAHSVVRQGCPNLLVAVDHPGKDPLTADLSGFERALGSNISTVRVDAAAYAAEIVRCQRTCASPLPSHSFVAQAQQAAVVRAAGCRVLFGGDGADELFGGYPSYLSCADPDGPYSPSPYTARRQPGPDFLDDDPKALDTALADAWRRACDAYAFVGPSCDRARLAMMLCDTECQLPAVGLRSADLMSMMWSVETRSVFLRRPVIEFALNLPAGVKADPRAVDPLLQTKPLLKHLFRRRFPSALLRDKQGFAGFPNESSAWLGAPDDFVALDYLGMSRDSLPAALADRSDAWKLVNVEYFLRFGER